MGKLVGDILKLAYGRALPKRDRADGAVPVYGSGGLIGWHNKALIEQSTVIVGRKGTVGSVFFASQPSYPIDTTYWVIPSKLDPELIYWTLSSLPLADLDSHAAVPGISRESIYDQPLPDHWPPPPELIAMLSLIRERVTITHNTADTLNDIAQSLYQDWQKEDNHDK